MKIVIETRSYNEKRFSTPWIAVVDFVSKSGDFHFGSWIGQHGEEGILEIECEVDDVIATGQKDYRKPRNSAPQFYVVLEDSELEPISKAGAYQHWQNTVKNRKSPVEINPLAGFSTEQLQNEINRRNQ